MKKTWNKIKENIKATDKKTLAVYLILRILIIICLISELIRGNYENAMLCILSLILFMLPAFIQKKFKIVLPSTLEIIILLFIFSAEILGTVNHFYAMFDSFDDILHTINGFIAASVGFSLVYLLNENISSFKLSPFFIALVAFCFSMTIGVLWEFFEYSADNLLHMNTQRDTYIYELNSGSIHASGIEYTIMYDKDGRELDKINGYIDIGLHDTMSDLIVNFIGALVYCILGYLYIINKKKYKIIDKLIIKKV